MRRTPVARNQTPYRRGARHALFRWMPLRNECYARRALFMARACITKWSPAECAPAQQPDLRSSVLPQSVASSRGCHVGARRVPESWGAIVQQAEGMRVLARVSVRQAAPVYACEARVPVGRCVHFLHLFWCRHPAFAIAADYLIYATLIFFAFSFSAAFFITPFWLLSLLLFLLHVCITPPCPCLIFFRWCRFFFLGFSATFSRFSPLPLMLLYYFHWYCLYWLLIFHFAIYLFSDYTLSFINITTLFILMPLFIFYLCRLIIYWWYFFRHYIYDAYIIIIFAIVYFHCWYFDFIIIFAAIIFTLWFDYFIYYWFTPLHYLMMFHLLCRLHLLLDAIYYHYHYAITPLFFLRLILLHFATIFLKFQYFSFMFHISLVYWLCFFHDWFRHLFCHFSLLCHFSFALFALFIYFSADLLRFSLFVITPSLMLIYADCYSFRHFYLPPYAADAGCSPLRIFDVIFTPLFHFAMPALAIMPPLSTFAATATCFWLRHAHYCRRYCFLLTFMISIFFIHFAMLIFIFDDIIYYIYLLLIDCLFITLSFIFVCHILSFDDIYLFSYAIAF